MASTARVIGIPSRRSSTSGRSELRGSWYVSRSPVNPRSPKRCWRSPSKVGSVTPAAMASRRRRSTSTSRSARACAAMSSRASSSDHEAAGDASIAANRAVGSSRTVPRYRRLPCRHVPGNLCRRRSRPAGRDHGHHRRGHHLRRAGRRGQPPLARVPSRGPATRRSRGPVPRELVPLPLGGLGGALRRALLHRDELPAHDGGDGLHHRRLRRPGLRDLRLQGRAGRRAPRADATGRAAVDDRRCDRRLRSLRDRPRRAAAHAPARRPGRGPGHALQLGHHGSAEGGQGAAAGSTAGRGRRRRHRAGAAPVRRRRVDPLPLACPALPRGPAALLPRHPSPRRHRGGDGALRCRAVPRPRRGARHHLQPGGPDDVHPPPQAARGGARPLRPVVAPRRRARGGAVPGGGQGADHRLVRADHPRVLRRHGGQRLRVLQQPGLARPPGNRRQGHPRCRAHRGGRRRGGAHRRVGHGLLRGGARLDLRVPQRRREDGRAPATRRGAGGARSATWATWTPTASST